MSNFSVCPRKWGKSNYISTKLELNKLANGYFDQKAERFIRKREHEIKNDDSILLKSYLNHVKNVRKNNPSLFKSIKTFNNIVSYFSNKVPEYIIEILENSVTKDEAIEISNKLESFPALRSTIRANLYYQFIMITQITLPSSDKVDDYRHVIDASYSKSFLTKDRQLGRTVKKINPDLQVIYFEDIFSEY